VKLILTFAVVGFAFASVAQIDTNQPARFKTKVVSYEGKVGSGTSSSAISPTPSAIFPKNETRNIITSPGHESDLRWFFLGRDGNKDVYHFTFTRMTNVNSSVKTTTSRDCSFEGRPVIVFTDNLHTVVMESPGKKDIGAAR
jgi:hypothetical protein